MIVINNESRVRKISGIFLFPSLNKIGEKDAEKLKSHLDFKYAVDKGNFTIREEKIEEVKETGDIVEYISGLTVKEAKEEISEVYDVGKLRDISEEDSRSGVKKAVEKQLEEMEVNLNAD